MGSAFPINTAAKTILAGTALLFLGACASVPVTSDGDKQVGSAQILSICEKLAKSNDTRIAIGLCEKAHTEDPENPVPLLILGDMLQQQGALAQAGRAYGMAIELDPENVEAHYGLGKVFLARNQFELATEQFEVARELNARDHRLYNALGVVLDNLGDHIAAQEHYRVGLELAPNNRALKKNLTLSRRLDDSVTSPAIGPRFEVVPGPASTPGGTPNDGGGPAIAPRPATQQRQEPGAPSGRLGHEPLAYAPSVPPQKSPYMPETKALVAQSHTRQFTVAGRTAPSVSSLTGADVIGPDEFPATIPAYLPRATATRAETRAQEDQDARIVLTQSQAMDPISAMGAKVKKAKSASLAYFPIIAPTGNETPGVTQKAQPKQTETELSFVQPARGSIHVTAARAPALGRRIEAGPRILGSGYKTLVVEHEILADARPSQPAQIAALPAGRVEVEKPLTQKRAADTRVSATLVPKSVAEGLTAETPASSMLLDVAIEEAPVRSVQLTLTENRYGTEKTAPLATPVPTPLPRVSRQRFGREHEGDHETRHIEGEFWDLVDVVNPMQHIPVVASIYRDVTDDEIKPAARIAGGTLFGGVLGFASSIFDSMVEEVSGEDMTQTAVTALSQDQTGDADVDALRVQRERDASRRLMQETRR